MERRAVNSMHPIRYVSVTFISLEENLVLLEEQLKKEGRGFYFFSLFGCLSPDEIDYFGVPLNYSSCPVVYWAETGRHIKDIHQWTAEDIEKRSRFPMLTNVIYEILELCNRAVVKQVVDNEHWFVVDDEEFERIHRKFAVETLPGILHRPSI